MQTQTLPWPQLKPSLLVLACTLLLGACVPASHVTRTGVTLTAVAPSSFDCAKVPGAFDLELKILQSGGDPTGINCTSGAASCTPTPRLNKNQWVRWTLDSGSTTETFYVIFTDDESPAFKNRKRGASISASRGGELCLKVNGSANSGNYNYSVYVKHCALNDPLCRPEVLDPILYVR